MRLEAPNFTTVASAEVGDAPAKGQSRPRRLTPHKDELVSHPVDGIATVSDVLVYAARTHGTKPAVGWRDVINTIEEEKEVIKVVGGEKVKQKKTWKYFQLSEYKYLNYIEIKDTVNAVAVGMAELGFKKGEVFNIYAATSINWQVMFHAASSLSLPVATAYDTLGESGLTHALNEPECAGLFANAELLPSLTRVLANTPTIRVVIYDGDATQDVLDKLKAAKSDMRVVSLDEVKALGKDKPAITDRLPTKDDTACIMYTSGSTGAPKGVVLTHSNLIASVGAIYHLLGHVLEPTDTFLAFLPLAHILEYIVELTFFFVGITTGYARVKTLTDASVRNCDGDIRAFRPSIMIGVPAVWETIRKGIVGKVDKMSTVKRSVFNASIGVKKYGVPVLAGVVDSVVLSAVKQQTGGRLRYALSGGAAISVETQEFLSLSLVTVLQGYGLTESCGMCAILPPEFFQYGVAGVPVPSIEIKLLDVPEAGYFANGKPAEGGQPAKPPQGEILIRGPSVTRGYFKRDDLNNDKSIFPGDGWFATGDVGQWNTDGTLSIIDRVKNLVKLSGGEYIALERLESVYKACNLVANMCVHGTSKAKQPIAIVFPHEANLRHALGKESDGKSFHDLCEEQKVIDLVLQECNNLGKKNQFKSMEMLEGIVLTSEEWTPENEMTTAAQKVNRKKIETAFKDEIKAAYIRAGEEM